MKKAIAIILAAVVIISMFSACSSNEEATTTVDTSGGLYDGDEYGSETVYVTDKDGKTVTDKNGEKVTEEVNVLYAKDKNGKTIAQLLDENGDVVTKKNGEAVTVKTDYDIDKAKAAEASARASQAAENSDTASEKVPTTKAQKTTSSTTQKMDGGEATTQKEITTLDYKKDKVPTIADSLKSSSKKAVAFSTEDQQIIKYMLEVPYLYKASYENKDGVPISIASHAAIWMAEREGLNTSTYASGTIVLDLFKYFGQTVVNFKTKCNDEGKCDLIKYNSKSDTFTISDFENTQQEITIKKIEYLGNNNYYLVTADVKNVDSKSKVYAIIQKNKLEISLGFSIKALKWE